MDTRQLLATLSTTAAIVWVDLAGQMNVRWSSHHQVVKDVNIYWFNLLLMSQKALNDGQNHFYHFCSEFWAFQCEKHLPIDP